MTDDAQTTPTPQPDETPVETADWTGPGSPADAGEPDEGRPRTPTTGDQAPTPIPDEGEPAGAGAGGAVGDAPADAREAIDEADAATDEARDGASGAATDDATAVAAERDEYLSHLQRLQAEFENYRKRALREQQEAARGAVTRLLLDLLPVVDDLDRAIALGAQSEIDVDQFRAGLDLVKRNLGDVLGRHGVEEVDALGHPFDPHRHEALMMRPVTGDDEGRQGEVIEVFQPGFTLNGRVVRPARVVVAGEV